MWNALDGIIKALSWMGAMVAALALAVLSVSVIWEVIARGVFRSPTIWSMEISTYGIATICFLGLGWVLRQGRHLEIDLVIARLPERLRQGIGIATDAFSAAFCALLVWYGANFVDVSYIIGSVSVSELPIGFALLGLEFIARILVRIGLVRRGIAAVEAVEST
jgi:TRAP-type C4-dicarboxylate transport system permease small subunit